MRRISADIFLHTSAYILRDPTSGRSPLFWSCTTLEWAVLTVIEAFGQRPSCVPRLLICFLTCTLIKTYPFMLPYATSATRSVYSLRLSKSFLNLRLGLSILNYVFAWVICVLGSYRCRAGLSFIRISNFVCWVSDNTTQVYYLVFINSLYFLDVYVVHV